MGSCCSGGASTDVILEEERNASNPLPPYNDWASELKSDFGSDPSAVWRDFPRMDVKVYADHLLDSDPPARQPEVSDDSSPGFGKNQRQPFDESGPNVSALEIRRNRVVGSLLAIARVGSGLGGDGRLSFQGSGASPMASSPPPPIPLQSSADRNGQQDYGSASVERAPNRGDIDQANESTGLLNDRNRSERSGARAAPTGAHHDEFSPRSVVASQTPSPPRTNSGSILSTVWTAAWLSELERLCTEHVGLHEADLSHPLQKVLLKSGMVLEKEQQVPTPATTSTQEANTVEVAAQPVSPSVLKGKDRYVVAASCHAMTVLLAFSQGIMFYPSQRMRHLLWFPWAAHLRDVGWNATVFRLAMDPTAVVIWHEQSVKNYVSDDAKKSTPQFRVSWRLEMIVSLVDGSITSVNLKVTSAKFLELSSATSALAKGRRRQFQERMTSHFGVDVEE